MQRKGLRKLASEFAQAQNLGEEETKALTARLMDPATQEAAFVEIGYNPHSRAPWRKHVTNIVKEPPGYAPLSPTEAGRNASRSTVPMGGGRTIDITDHSVRILLINEMADLEKQKGKILARQVKIARFGSEEGSTRAAQLLARIAGWYAPSKITGDMRHLHLSLHDILSDPNLIDSIDGLEHEPGDAAIVYTEARQLPSGDDE